MIQRQSVRYDHIYISLKFQDDKSWNWTQAYNWSNHGFNFFQDQELPLGSKIKFKKSLATFEGEVVWAKKKLTEEEAFHMAINSLLTRKYKEKFTGEAFSDEFVSLIRTQNVEHKLKYAQVNLQFNVSRSLLLEERRLHPWREKSQFGVKMLDSKWERVVDVALGYSSGIADLDQGFSQKLNKLVAKDD